MRISGWIKQSLMDYPGKVASVIFTQGCNFRCPYCHNPELIPWGQGVIPESTVLAHLEKNRFLLDGLVITGGEPTMQVDLFCFMKKIKGLGLVVKLDTNGTHPQLLHDLIRDKLVDYIAMDVKSAPELSRYSLPAGVKIIAKLMDRIKTSIRLIIDSGIDHEFRTTLCRELVSLEDLDLIMKCLRGSRRYYLQQYRPFEQKKERSVTFTAFPDEWIKQVIDDRNSGIDIRLRP